MKVLPVSVTGQSCDQMINCIGKMGVFGSAVLDASMRTAMSILNVPALPRLAPSQMVPNMLHPFTESFLPPNFICGPLVHEQHLRIRPAQHLCRAEHPPGTTVDRPMPVAADIFT